MQVSSRNKCVFSLSLPPPITMDAFTSGTLCRGRAQLARAAASTRARCGAGEGAQLPVGVRDGAGEFVRWPAGARRPRRVRAAAGGSWCIFMSIDVSALYVSHGCTYVHDTYERTANNQTATITNWNPAVAMCRADQVLSLKQNYLHSVPSSMIFRGWMP